MKFTLKQIPGFNDYTYLGNFKIKCNICNKEMETGIFNMCKHSEECIGSNNTTSDEIWNNLKNGNWINKTIQ